MEFSTRVETIQTTVKNEIIKSILCIIKYLLNSKFLMVISAQTTYSTPTNYQGGTKLFK